MHLCERDKERNRETAKQRKRVREKARTRERGRCVGEGRGPTENRPAGESQCLGGVARVGECQGDVVATLAVARVALQNSGAIR